MCNLGLDEIFLYSNNMSNNCCLGWNLPLVATASKYQLVGTEHYGGKSLHIEISVALHISSSVGDCPLSGSNFTLLMFRKRDGVAIRQTLRDRLLFGQRSPFMLLC
jgi:hypothetical protein